MADNEDENTKKMEKIGLVVGSFCWLEGRCRPNI
jgi:hypothetical protein